MPCNPCTITAAEVEGEYVCVKCGRVLGSIHVASIEDVHSHYILHAQNEVKPISKYIKSLTTNLNLPDFAYRTIVRVASELIDAGVRHKHALLFATLYACREHNIPRLLSDILDAMRQTYGIQITGSSVSLLKMLNKASKKAYDLGYKIKSPDINYYLQAYLAKIQDLVIEETSSDYYEHLRIRSFKVIDMFKSNDPSLAAKKAILYNICSTLQRKIESVLREDLNV